VRTLSTLFVRSVAARALLLVAPPVCAACDAPLEQDRLFCTACEPATELVEDRLATGLRVIATAPFDGAIAAAIRRYKYGGRPDLARLLGARLALALRSASIGVSHEAATWLVPVPLHAERLAERGYNQSALIAAYAGPPVGIPLLTCGLARTRRTVEQAALQAKDRGKNVDGAFVVKPGAVRARLRGADVILVDDVVTTGATALACARALEHVGACVLCVAGVARAGHT
jgi:ComF family protein